MLHPNDFIRKFMAMRFFMPLLAAFAIGACSLPRWPVEAPLTSPYGIRFFGLRPDFHEGVDISVPVGTPVAAMTSGTVAFAGDMRGYGLVIVLRHSASLRTVYAHLSRIDVRAGQRVAGRQLIGLSGKSGNASGPHLHFEVQRWGHAEDPVPLLGGAPGR
jgi:murein DD-endopeptidase MepM/ murein hydrolase activator NlpD